MNACEKCNQMLDADAASCPQCYTPVKESLDIDSTPRVTQAAGKRMSQKDEMPGQPLQEGLTSYRPTVWLGVNYFNHDSRIGNPMQPVHDISHIETIRPSGRTGTAKAIRHGAAENLKIPAAKHIGIVVTDGGATDAEMPGKTPQEDAEDATTEAIDKGMLMTVIGLGVTDKQVLEGLASAPSYVETTGVSNIKEALTKMTERTTKSATVGNGISVILMIDESASMLGQEESVRKAVEAVLDLLKGLV